MTKIIRNTEQDIATKLLINLGNDVLKVSNFNLTPTI